MKKRVISWLLCLALCLSMLPVAALAEDVQKPEGPASSMNEPEPEAEEKETPAPKPEEQPEENPTEEPEQKEPEQEPKQEQEESPIEQPEKEPEAENQPELMTVGNLSMPLTGGETFSLSPIYVMQNSAEISDDITDTGVLKQSVNVVIYIYGLTKDQVASLLPAAVHGIKASVDGVEVSSGGFYDETAGGWRHTWSFTPTKNEYTIDFSINYEGTEQTAQRTIKFESCKHPSRNNAGKCSQCDATLVAEINSATYYASLSEALDAAQTIDDCTITLLDDAGLSGDYTVTKGKFTIDLKTFSQGSGTINVAGTADVTVKNESNAQFKGNFCWSGADAKLTLAEGSAYANLSVAVTGKTVADLLPGGCGYQASSGNWVSESGLNQTTIQSVLVKKAPFTVDDFSVNSSSYINVPFQISASVRSSNFPNGHIDFDYCLYIDDIQKKTGKQNSYSRLYMDCTLEDGSQHTAKLVVSYNGYSVTKTLVLQAVACPHTTIVQTTGKCNVCKLQMAASVSPEALVIRRTYYETFDAALSAAWEQLKTGDCWLVLFQDTTISSPIANERISGEHAFRIELNGKKITCANNSVFRVPESSKWTLDLRVSNNGGSLIGGNASYGTIDVAAGGYANIDVRGNYTITNTANAERAIVVRTQNSSVPSQVKIGKAEIAGDDSTQIGGIVALGGKVAINGGNFTSARATGENAELKFYSGTVSGNVTVDNHGVLRTVAESGAIFKGTTTITATGYAYLEGGTFKSIVLNPGYQKTLGELLPNQARDYFIGEELQKNAKSQTSLTAEGDEYIYIKRHNHNYGDNGICSICDDVAQAKLLYDNNTTPEFGTFWQMLAKAQDNENSQLILWSSPIELYNNATVTKGKFYISGNKQLKCNNGVALIISGGDVQIADITVDRLKVTGDGKLTLNGGKYYAIDVTDSTVYTNYGEILATNRAFKHQSTWESKTSITGKSFDVTSTNAPKSVEKPPFDSVSVTPASKTANYGESVTFTAAVIRDDSSKALSYQWCTVASDGTKTAIEGKINATLTVNEAVGTYQYLCQVTCEDYTLSSNTVQLTVQRIDLSSAALSATITGRAYDGTTSAKIEDGSSLTLGNMTVPASEYTLSAVFADKNAGENKNVTVTVKLTNTNYCFDYDADGTPILEKTFETTGTITQNTDSREPISVDENIYNSAAHTYKFDLDSYLTAIKDDLGTMSYGTPEPNSLQRGIRTPVLEGHTLKLPVSAIRWASETSLGRITIPVNSQNYANVSIEICLKLVERTAVTASATPSKTELTYGERLDTIALSGTTDPTIQGTFVWQTPDAILDAGRHADLVWKFIPADYTYAEASGTAEITVKQAKLTDPAPVTLTIYNGWAATYEAALPELPALAEGLRFGNDAAYGKPVVSASGYYSSGAELKTVNGKQGVSIPILKNETTEEGQAGTITVQYTSQNYEPVTLAINLVAKNRTAPTFILTADHDTLSGGGKVTLTLERGNLPDGAVVTVSGTDEAGNAVTLTDNDDGTYSASLPNKTQTYTFIAAYDGSQTIAPKTDFTTVKVQQRSSGGEPAKPSFPVKISHSGDGKVTVDKSYASAGDKVTITVTPGRNGSVQRITVTDKDGERLKLTENRDGTYSFTMPSGTANVYVRFSGSGLPFADVPSGSWYYDDVAYVYDTGLMTGLTVTAFGPNLSTTRGMIVTILWRMENEPAAKNGCPFADVRRGSYYEQAIAWASENGIVTGFDASTFAPDRTITREQLAAILFRFAAYRGMDAVTLRENLSSFQDQAAISAYAVSALNWAVGEGLMQGTGDKLEPTGSATRAQVAAMLRRFIQRNF